MSHIFIGVVWGSKLFFISTTFSVCYAECNVKFPHTAYIVELKFKIIEYFISYVNGWWTQKKSSLATVPGSGFGMWMVNLDVTPTQLMTTPEWWQKIRGCSNDLGLKACCWKKHIHQIQFIKNELIKCLNVNKMFCTNHKSSCKWNMFHVEFFYSFSQ